MSDNPMYWPGHQRPAWHQQPPSAQPVSSMGHYVHHGGMLGNPMTPGMPGDPSLLMQPSIPGRQTHQSTLSHHQANPLAPAGPQSTLYPGMNAPGAQGSSRQASQLASNSHLSSASNPGLPPHSNIQQNAHPQSHYPHQYSSYWNPPPLNSQSSLGPPTAGAPQAGSLSTSGQPAADNANNYHSSASPLNLPADSRGSLTNNSSTSSMQQTASSFHSPKDIQAPEHVHPYDRRGSIGQQTNSQHPGAMMSQNVPPSSTASTNLSPTQSQMTMQGRLQSQNPMDSIRSMPQQSNIAPSWSSGSYYGQSTQSPYSSVMNPYMPYGGTGAVPNNSVIQQQPRLPINQKPPTNGSTRGPAPSYPTHGTLYGQPTAGTTNGTYYGYDSYYNQTPSDLYLSHQNPSGPPQHWPPTGPNNQMMSNSSNAGQMLRPPAGSNNATILPQSPSASSLPTISSRTPAPSQTPDRSPAPPSSYPSPNQQGSSAKSTSGSLAQLEQMVMPNSGQNAAPIVKTPPQQSSSPSNSGIQQQMQYSYNSSGQGSYFTSGSNSNQSSYYPQYESTGTDVQKPVWPEQGSHLTPVGSSGSQMIEVSQNSSYGQVGFDGSSSYGEFTQLSAPGSNTGQSRFPGPGEASESQSSDKGDPYAIDSQTFDDFEDQTSSSSKVKKSRAKKGEEKVKRERKPRAPRAPKSTPAVVQPKSPSVSVPAQITQHRLSVQTPENNSSTQQTSYPSPNRQNPIKTVPELTLSGERSTTPTNSPNVAIASSPSQRLPSESPNALTTATNNQKMSNSSNAGQIQTQLCPSTGSNNATILPQSPSASSLPTISSRTPAPSQTPDRSPAPPSSYPSPNQQGSSGKSTSGCSTHFEQMVMPNSGQSTVPMTVKTPPQEPSTSPTNSGIQQQMQYSYNSSGQGSYFTSGSNSNQSSYYPQYESTGTDVQKPVWPEQGSLLTPVGSSGSQMIEVSQNSSYGQVGFDGSSSYGEFTQLSAPGSNTGQSRFPGPGEASESQSSDKGDPINQPTENSQALEDFEDQTSSSSKAKKSKAKKSRSKKGEEKVKRERKPRAPRAPKSTPAVVQPKSPSVSVQTPENNSSTQQTSFMDITPSGERSTTPTNSSNVAIVSSPSQRLSTESPNALSQLKEESTEPIPDQAVQEVPVETPKPKRIRIRDSSSKGKKKLPKFALKFAKTKKRKRLGSSDNEQSDLDKTPPPSPDEVESGVQKRRSARNTKKLKYNDDIELGFSESDDEGPPKSKKSGANVSDSNNGTSDIPSMNDEPTVFAAPVEDTMVVEKIMSSRTGKRELEPEPGETLPPDGTFIDVEEYFVKYKNLSYLHCDWRTLEELEEGDRRVSQKIKRYKQKKDSSNIFSFMDEELFDPQYCEVDRILAVNEVLKPSTTPEPIEPSNTSTQPTESSTTPSQSTESITTPSQSTESLAISTQATESITTPSQSTESLATSTQATESITTPSQSVESLATSTQPTESLTTPTPPTEPLTTSAQPTEPITKPTQTTSTSTSTTTTTTKEKITKHYLVKWRGLSYEESTWELEDDLDPAKIKQFERFKDLPPKSKWKHVKRPKPEEWVRKEVSPVYKNNNTLREYQLEGINWLSFCWHQGRNCILADEMGLGKTIQSIAFVNEIYEHNINGPFLIIVPLSTVGNWAREFETWTDLNVITYHGSSTSREMLKEYEMYYRNEKGNRVTNYYKFQVMITTFEIILSDCLELREIPWRCCIIDEAHRLKNRNCKLLEGLRLLNMEHRVLLTGTPLQNNVEELFSLLNFLEPTQFSSTEQFLQEFGDLKTEAQVDKLKLILKPMMLRRLKEDVEKSLAPKEETIVEVELTNIQKKYYRAILEKNFSFLSKGASNNNMPNLMNTMMELRKCCIHPYLINGAEEQILYEAKQTRLAGGEAMSSHQAMINASGKLVLIDKLLPRLRADGHRVLIFSQMVRCLDILEDYVTHKHYPYERIDGRVRGGDRQQAIDRFSKPGSDRFVFLLCTRAGGLGINLTAADTVIIFDSDWNPQNDLQAQARCHRIGQSKAVKIYRLICRNTYEREMFDKASLKLGLDKAVLQSMNTQKAAGGIDGQLTKKEIEELLRKGAYGALMDDDNAGDKFCEEDIDQILSRRTQVITIDNSEAKGSTFSKATFSSSNNREDIELDDPNFWEKWAKKANLENDDLNGSNELIQLAPRRRTQTKRYGADGNLLDISELESSEEDEETISMRTRGGRVRQSKLTPSSASKRGNKRNRVLDEDDDDEYSANIDGGLWSKSDCLKLEKGLLTYGWGQWDKILASNTFKKELSTEDCEVVCRVIILYCVNSYKGDEKIRTFAWELICPPDESMKPSSDSETCASGRGRKPKSTPVIIKKSVTEEIAEAKWPKEAKNDPLIALPDDQYRRHLQRNCNRLLIRVKFLHYLKNEILKDYQDKILSDCDLSEVDLPPVPVDGDLPAPWWDEDADKSLLVGIFKHGHDKFISMRQDPNLCFLKRCGPPNKDDLIAEFNSTERNEDFDDDNRDGQLDSSARLKFDDNSQDPEASDLLEQLINVISDEMDEGNDSLLDENKNSIMKYPKTRRSDIIDEESVTLPPGASLIKDTSQVTQGIQDEHVHTEFLPFPTPNELNQRFRKLITAYQRNSKKLEIQLAQKARDELKRERTSKFEAAKNEREERKRFLAQKWSRREEADFFRAISSFGVEYDPELKRHDWNKFRTIAKLDKKLDETLEEYYKAFVVMCKKVMSRPLTEDEEKFPISVDPVTEDRASRCLLRIELLNKIREQVITHPELDERLKLCMPQSDLPDWWENGRHDKDLLIAAARHGLTRLDYNLAHDPSLSFTELIKQKVSSFFSQPPTPILIPVEQLQELLDINGIEYIKDIDNNQDDSEVIRSVINSIIDNIDVEISTPHSSTDDRVAEDSSDKTTQSRTSRSQVGQNSTSSRPLPSILTRRGPNTVVKSADGAGPNPCSVRLEHTTRFDDRGVIEITPLIPDTLPEDPPKTFEAGEISVKINSESALLQMDGRAPIILFGATNPVAAKIRWPKDKAIQTRLENLVLLVEKNEWPSPPKPPIPVITLPNHLTRPLPTAPVPVTTTPPSKVEKYEVSIGSPKSDSSNMSSKASRQDPKETSNDAPTTRGKRGRGRKPKQPDVDEIHQQSQDVESPKDDRQAAAKLRNLLSQHPKSSRSSGSGEKLTAKFGGNKQGAGLSSLLASFKEKRNDGSSSSRDDKDMYTPELMPNLFNLKPELREAATSFLMNMNNNNVAANLRSTSNSQMSLENLLNVARSTKGPPPAHQRSDNPPSAHGSSTRELRRNSQNVREQSPPSFNLRSTRGRGSVSGIQNMNHHKPVELAHTKQISQSNSKKRCRPNSSASESPPNAPGGDILDLSSLPMGGKSSAGSRAELRSRRYKDHIEEPAPNVSTRSSSGTPTKASLKANMRQSEEHEPEQTPEVEMRTTRARKRIGSRIDALALNLQAKRLNRGDSPTGDVSPPPPSSNKEKSESSSAFGSQKSHESRSSSSKAPPAAHSGAHKLSNTTADHRNEKSSPLASNTALPSMNSQQAPPPPPPPRQDILSQLMSNPASLLAGLNPASLGGAGDLMNQLLRKPGTNDVVKNLMNEFIKNPSLGLDPNILATLSASLPLNTQGLPGFNLPPPTSMPSTSNKTSSNSLLNDFKSPYNNLSKRSRPESNSSRQSSNVSQITDSRRSTTTPDRHERKSSNERRLSHHDRADRSGKQDKRASSSNQQDSDAHLKRSSSLLAHQTSSSQSNQTASSPMTSQSSLPGASSLNLANQFGGLNSLSSMLNFPGISELMKQMSNFPGAAAAAAGLPRVSVPPPSSSSGSTPTSTQSSDKGLRRSRQSLQPPQSVSAQQATNSALANSIMNLASQSNSGANPYANFANPLANPFLPFGLGNLGLNNPLGMSLFPNLYLPPGFPTSESQPPTQPQSGSAESGQKDKKLRFPRK